MPEDPEVTDPDEADPSESPAEDEAPKDRGADIAKNVTIVTAFLFLGNYNLVLEGVCDSDLSTGYSYDAIMMITEKGENNYGNLSLDAVGGGCP